MKKCCYHRMKGSFLLIWFTLKWREKRKSLLFKLILLHQIIALKRYYLKSSEPPCKLVKLFTIHRWGSWDSDWFSDLPSSRVTGIHTHVCLSVNYIRSTVWYSLLFLKKTSILIKISSLRYEPHWTLFLFHIYVTLESELDN